MSSTVMLRCPKCKRKMRVKKEDTDYADTATVEIICPKCDDGDFHEPVHPDKNGKHLYHDTGRDGGEQ